MENFLSDNDKWNLLFQRDIRSDIRSDYAFFYGVLTTGVYCRPACSSRLPNRKNVRFFSTCEEAEKAGFRPCKRCHPDEKEKRDLRTLAVLNACRIIEDSDNPLNLEKIAEKAGFNPYYFHRIFKRIVGITPKQYAMEIRLKKTRDCLRSGQTVTDAIYNSGFESSSRFYEKSTAVLGMSPSAYKNGAPDIEIQHAVAQSDIGWVLVAMTEKGICSVTLGDSPEKLKEDLYQSFPKAKFKDPDRNFGAVLEKVLALISVSHSRSFELPLDIRGTAFQRRVWDALQEIAPGSTASYAEIAASIGEPSAARAVARACAANPVAVVIPCHRVIRRDGKLSGYRWGIERKRILLERESNMSAGTDARPQRGPGSLKKSVKSG